MSFNKQSDIEILKDLIEDYNRKNVSALIGSGFSKNVCQKSFMSWGELLSDAYLFLYKDQTERSYLDYLQRHGLDKDKQKTFEEYVVDKVNDENLLDLVSKYIEKKGYREAIDGYIELRTPYAEKVGNTIKLTNGAGETKEVDESAFSVHKQLLSCSNFVNLYTTNYDNLLEFTAEHYKKSNDSKYVYRKDPICKGSDLSNNIRSQNIIKIHGSLPIKGEEYEFDNDSNLRYVISKEDYDTYKIKHEAFAYLMRIAMLQGKFCLIGFSGVDPNYISWLDWMKDIVQKDRRDKDVKQDTKVYLINVNKDYVERTNPKDEYCRNMYNENHHVSVLHIFDKDVLNEIYKTNYDFDKLDRKDVLCQLLKYIEDSEQDASNRPNENNINESQNKKYQKGFDYYYGTDDVEQNYDRAYANFMSSYKENPANEVKALLAECYFYGRGTQVDIEKAKELCEGNDKVSNNLLDEIGECYFYGMKGLDKDYNKAVEWYQKAADRGNPDAQFTLGNIYQEAIAGEKNLNKAEEQYKNALNAYRELSKIKPDVYEPYVAMTLNNLANLHSKNNDYEAAEKEYKEALEIRRKLAEKNPDAYVPDVATTLNNLAALHDNSNDYEAAEKEYKEALEIRRKLAEKNTDAYEPDVAATLNNLAALHYNTNDYEAAEKEYQEALEIRRKLAKKNPDAYEPDVATTLNNLAVLHENTNDYEAAEKEYQEALEIRRKLAKKNPDAYEPDVATTLNNLAILHKNTNNYEAAKKEYQEALEIRRKLAKKNPDAYEPYVADTLNNLALLHCKTNDYEAAEKEYKEALEIRRKLAKKNPDAYEPNVVDSFAGLGLLYYAKGEKPIAIKYLKEAIEILIPYAEKYPKVYGKKLNHMKNFLKDLQESK